MFEIIVNEKSYKIAYNYETLANSTAFDNKKSDNIAVKISEIAELLLTGMQIHHYNEFPIETDSQRKKSLKKIYALMDTYDEESTEETPKNVFDLSQKITDELKKKGFFAGLIRAEAEARAKLVQEVIEAGKRNS